MVISLSLRIVDQIGTSVRFWPKKLNAETLKAIVSKTAPLTKLPSGGSYLFMKYDVFIQNAEFFMNRADTFRDSDFTTIFGNVF